MHWASRSAQHGSLHASRSARSPSVLRLRFGRLLRYIATWTKALFEHGFLAARIDLRRAAAVRLGISTRGKRQTLHARTAPDQLGHDAVAIEPLLKITPRLRCIDRRENCWTDRIRPWRGVRNLGDWLERRGERTESRLARRLGRRAHEPRRRRHSAFGSAQVAVILCAIWAIHTCAYVISSTLVERGANLDGFTVSSRLGSRFPRPRVIHSVSAASLGGPI
jgi:hypothetical protein